MITSLVARSVCASLATAAVVAIVSTTVTVTAEAGSTAGPSTVKPKKPIATPTVKGHKKRWGSTVSATTAQGGRQQKDESRTTHPKHIIKTTTADGGKPKRSLRPQADDRRSLRLNTGICGRLQPDGTVPGPTRCQPGGEDRRATRRTVPPPEVVRPKPQDVTWEQVRSETKNIVFPGLSVKVQPNGRTLVNLDTIVYADDSRVSRTTVTLLGFPVLVEATPISYTWNFGDGSPALTTSTPGKPYPSKEITHKYMKRGSVGLTVTTNYAARFNVADTGWQYIDGTVPITGPITPLLVREAVPVLVDPGR